MALGTNYARIGRKTDLLVKWGMKQLDEGMSREDVDKTIKRMRRKTVAEILEWVKSQNTPKETKVKKHFEVTIKLNPENYTNSDDPILVIAESIRDISIGSIVKAWTEKHHAPFGLEDNDMVGLIIDEMVTLDAEDLEEWEEVLEVSTTKESKS